MNSSYILIDLVSGNVISDFASESEAWDALRQWASDDGLQAIEDLSLMCVQEEHPRVIAMEGDLVQHVARDLNESLAEAGRHQHQVRSLAS